VYRLGKGFWFALYNTESLSPARLVFSFLSLGQKVFMKINEIRVCFWSPVCMEACKRQMYERVTTATRGQLLSRDERACLPVCQFLSPLPVFVTPRRVRLKCLGLSICASYPWGLPLRRNTLPEVLEWKAAGGGVRRAVKSIEGIKGKLK
jgi:hypothetical protein